MRNALDSILFEADQPNIKVYAQSALDETSGSDDGLLLTDFIKWFRTHPEYEQRGETSLVELYKESLNSRIVAANTH